MYTIQEMLFTIQEMMDTIKDMLYNKHLMSQAVLIVKRKSSRNPKSRIQGWT